MRIILETTLATAYKTTSDFNSTLRSLSNNHTPFGTRYPSGIRYDELLAVSSFLAILDDKNGSYIVSIPEIAKLFDIKPLSIIKAVKTYSQMRIAEKKSDRKNLNYFQIHPQIILDLQERAMEILSEEVLVQLESTNQEFVNGMKLTSLARKLETAIVHERREIDGGNINDALMRLIHQAPANSYIN